jgi:hypothetical protein
MACGQVPWVPHQTWQTRESLFSRCLAIWRSLAWGRSCSCMTVCGTGMSCGSLPPSATPSPPVTSMVSSLLSLQVWAALLVASPSHGTNLDFSSDYQDREVVTSSGRGALEHLHRVQEHHDLQLVAQLNSAHHEFKCFADCHPVPCDVKLLLRQLS